MEDGRKDLYSCNGCTNQIPTHRARIDCHNCPGYHLCTNCFVIKQFQGPHLESHSTMVLKLSGYVVPTPPKFPPRPAPSLPPRHNTAVNARQTTRIAQLPTANWGALWNVMKAPLEKKDKKVTVDTNTDGPVEMKDVTSSPSSSISEKDKQNNFFSPLSLNSTHPVNTLPPSPLKSVRQGLERFDSTAPSYPRPASWVPLFEDDSTPTPIFIALMSTIFSHLDPEHTGYLSPEKYSEFLDVQGYEVATNLWKTTMLSDGSSNRKEIADLELALYYTDLSISHTLKIRSREEPTSPQLIEPSSPIGERIKSSMRFNANMPMLSRQGFIDLSAVEYLKDPSRGHESLGQAVWEYGVWKELGRMPRSVLPDSSRPRKVRGEGIVVESKVVTPGESSGSEVGSPPEGVGSKSDTESEEKVITPKISSPMKVKGGEMKIEALMSGAKFDEDQKIEEQEESLVEIKDKKVEKVTDPVPEVSLVKEKALSEEAHVEDLYSSD